MIASLASMNLLLLTSLAVVGGSQLCSEEYECDVTGDSMVGVYHAPTEEVCQAICRVTDTCTYYTWYEEDKTCFLLSSCDGNLPCSSSCHTGPTLQTQTTVSLCVMWTAKNAT